MANRSYVRLEIDGALATLTIDRQDKLNALNAQVIAELHDAAREVRTTRDVRCLIVTGAGEKAFVAGADISEMKEMRLDQARAFAQAGHAAFDALEALPFPVIAAVNGFALGGGTELALACDFIYASEKAKFGQPEVKLGVIPGFGGTQRLLRRVGNAHARELIYTGAIIGADEALRIGLANRVLPHGELLSAARATAATIAQMGPLAVAEAKKVMREGEGRLLRDANALEIDGFAGCFETDDQKEGMQAFLEKRAAAFKAE
ncbi:enoyl-CoA hydratase/isomerase family protein [Sandaracinus amylolyticus]|uniref:3-hydroxybutyryl-CoA dehydratase n=1 Tax=Sandaracinus amylolyticus TaxID=927083 RepID=A0A0F6YIQ7_9BACT|nr:enoyl-CoA hydratase-related protein [Sandaracinus amylolyticus]AKF07022.1 3-hydroxybutyryl-CoA dehydratase [Sandaracinus amylolyticus]